MDKEISTSTTLWFNRFQPICAQKSAFVGDISRNQ